MAGIASKSTGEVLIMADRVQDDLDFPDMGWCRGTYAVSVSNARSGVAPSSWKYSSQRMPGTTDYCNGPGSLQFFTAIADAGVPSQPDLVYLLGRRNDKSVLARANLSDLLGFNFQGVEFWSLAPMQMDSNLGTWHVYGADGQIPPLLAIMQWADTEASLHFDQIFGKWAIPAVNDEGDGLVMRVADDIIGPYDVVELGPLPHDIVP